MKQKKFVSIIGLSLAILFILIQEVAFAINFFMPERAILGLKLNGHRIAFSNLPALSSFLKKYEQEQQQPLLLAYRNKVFRLYPSALRGAVNYDQLAVEALSLGRQGNGWDRFVTQERALFGSYDVNPKVKLAPTAVQLALSKIVNNINTEPSWPQVDLANGKVTSPGQPGVAVDERALLNLIIRAISRPPSTAITIPTKEIAVRYDQNQVDALLKVKSSLVAAPLTISSAHRNFTLTPAELNEMIILEGRGNSGQKDEQQLMVRLDEKKLNQKLGVFAAEMESITHAEFDDHDARVAIYAQFYAGLRRLLEIPTANAAVISEIEQEQLYAITSSTLSDKASLSTATSLTTATTPKVIYLTFDDGPNATYHPQVLDILKHYNVKATFFLVGKNVVTYPDIARRTVAEGHQIGNHSYTHPFLPKLSGKSITEEIATTNQTLKPFNNNQDLTLFRPPYGGVNKTVRNDARGLNLKLVLWSVDPRDWSEPPTAELVRRVVDHTKEGSDILLHSNHGATVQALPQIIEQLQAKGFTFGLLGS